eukprot:GHVT01082338.1.p1 GENE.GHVT01082338.1~~GHVT01082338.1.p1  ORF type:complete len:1236 (-),score=201.88 GHVT01082338.1:223-3930(-)
MTFSARKHFLLVNVCSFLDRSGLNGLDTAAERCPLGVAVCFFVLARSSASPHYGPGEPSQCAASPEPHGMQQTRGGSPIEPSTGSDTSMRGGAREPLVWDPAVDCKLETISTSFHHTPVFAATDSSANAGIASSNILLNVQALRDVPANAKGASHNEGLNDSLKTPTKTPRCLPAALCSASSVAVTWLRLFRHFFRHLHPAFLHESQWSKIVNLADILTLQAQVLKAQAMHINRQTKQHEEILKASRKTKAPESNNSKRQMISDYRNERNQIPKTVIGHEEKHEDKPADIQTDENRTEVSLEDTCTQELKNRSTVAKDEEEAGQERAKGNEEVSHKNCCLSGVGQFHCDTKRGHQPPVPLSQDGSATEDSGKDWNEQENIDENVKHCRASRLESEAFRFSRRLSDISQAPPFLVYVYSPLEAIPAVHAQGVPANSGASVEASNGVTGCGIDGTEQIEGVGASQTLEFIPKQTKVKINHARGITDDAVFDDAKERLAKGKMKARSTEEKEAIDKKSTSAAPFQSPQGPPTSLARLPPRTIQVGRSHRRLKAEGLSGTAMAGRRVSWPLAKLGDLDTRVKADFFFFDDWSPVGQPSSSNSECPLCLSGESHRGGLPRAVKELDVWTRPDDFPLRPSHAEPSSKPQPPAPSAGQFSGSGAGTCSSAHPPPMSAEASPRPLAKAFAALPNSSLAALSPAADYCSYGQWGAEVVLSELFQSSRVRTFDPRQADFFFVPGAAICVFEGNIMNLRELDETYISLIKAFKHAPHSQKDASKQTSGAQLCGLPVPRSQAQGHHRDLKAMPSNILMAANEHCGEGQQPGARVGIECANRGDSPAETWKPLNPNKPEDAHKKINPHKYLTPFSRTDGSDHIFTFTSGASSSLFPSWALWISRAIQLTPETGLCNDFPSQRVANFNTWRDVSVPGKLEWPAIVELLAEEKEAARAAPAPAKSSFNEFPTWAGKKFLAVFHGTVDPTRGVHPWAKSSSVDVRSELVRWWAELPGVLVRKTFAPRAAIYKVMSRSVFCLVPRGKSAWSLRLFEALFAGCIPVVLSDEWQLPFESFIDMSQIVVKPPEKSAAGPQAVPPNVHEVNSFPAPTSTKNPSAEAGGGSGTPPRPEQIPALNSTPRSSRGANSAEGAGRKDYWPPNEVYHLGKGELYQYLASFSEAKIRAYQAAARRLRCWMIYPPSPLELVEPAVAREVRKACPDVQWRNAFAAVMFELSKKTRATRASPTSFY